MDKPTRTVVKHPRGDLDVRLMPGALLIWYVKGLCKPTSTFERLFFGAGNNRDTVIGICRELRRRPRILNNYVIALLNRLDPPPCGCGGPGIYIVGRVTYCRACRDLGAVPRAAKWARKRDARAGEVEAELKGIDRQRRESEQHHKAKGRRHSGIRGR